jgi:hypothetical protein
MPIARSAFDDRHDCNSMFGDIGFLVLLGLALAPSISALLALRREHYLTGEAVKDPRLPEPFYQERLSLSYMAFACLNISIMATLVLALYIKSWGPTLLLVLLMPGLALSVVAIRTNRILPWYDNYQRRRAEQGLPTRQWWDWRTS